MSPRELEAALRELFMAKTGAGKLGKSWIKNRCWDCRFSETTRIGRIRVRSKSSWTNREAAEELLPQHGLSLGSVSTVSVSVQPGTVFGQFPLANTKVL